ncbi:hypothetical protein HanRHA438_Chr15g0730491 [Helianthus annuus]|nr:hypothetical protein HanRHA438_Chr15g0730491 [Helianthus annuus]
MMYLVCDNPHKSRRMKLSEEIRDLARYAMSSSCVGEMMSSEFRDCDFCLDESQVLNCVLFMSFGCVV